MIQDQQTSWKGKCFFLFIIAQPLLDIIAYLQYENTIGSLAGYIRLGFALFFPLYALRVTPHKKRLIALLAPIAALGLLHVANGFRVGYLSLFQDAMYFMRTWYMPILAISFIFYFEQRRRSMAKLVSRAFMCNLMLIAATVLLAWATGTGRATYVDYQYGITGWFGDANSQSIILASLVPLSLCCLLQLRKKWLLPIALAVIILLLLSNGTRATYYALLLTLAGFVAFQLFAHLLKRRDGAKFPRYAASMLCLGLAAAIAALPYTPRSQMSGYAQQMAAQEQEQIDTLIEETMPTPAPTAKPQKEKPSKPAPSPSAELAAYYRSRINPQLIERYGFERVLAAYGGEPSADELRDMRLKKRIYAQLQWEDSDLLTKLVGFEYTRMEAYGDNFDLENDAPAVLYYYGYLGAALFIALFGWIFFLVLRRVARDFKGSMTPLNFALILTLLLQIGLLFYSGHLLRQPNASVYLAIVLALCYLQATEPIAGRPASPANEPS